MRRPIRPFITEFKNHSPKSSAFLPQTIEVADQVSARQPVLDSGAFARFKTNHDDGYEAALKAADEVFGKSNVAEPIEVATPSPKTPPGRVLPSLVGKEDALTIRLMEADKKGRRGSAPKNDKTASSVKRKKQIPPATSEVTQIFVEAPAAAPSPQILNVSTGRRERSSIQKRWVLKTELKAGQKWKRRLYKSEV
jgi:hypothetical protein